MRWLVILLLSLSGVAMGYLTLLPIGIRGEQLLWLVVFLVTSFAIFKFTEEKYFLHGFVLGIINCLWAVIIHICYYHTYLPNHPDIVRLNSRLDPGFSPYLALAFVEMTKSLFYAITSGIFAVIMSAGLKKYFE
jgi:hypothetical protein